MILLVSNAEKELKKRKTSINREREREFQSTFLINKFREARKVGSDKKKYHWIVTNSLLLTNDR